MHVRHTVLLLGTLTFAGCQCGPPTPSTPAGFSQIYATTATRDGVMPSLVLDGDDQPMVAFARQDSTGPESWSVLFTRYDGTKSAWTTPVVVATGLGALDDNPTRQQLWLARDSKDGRLGVAFTKTEQFCGTANSNPETTIHVSLSTDQGATWSTSDRVSEAHYTRNNDAVNGVPVCDTSMPRIAMKDGTVHVAWAANAGEVETMTNFYRGYYYGASTAPGTWSHTLLPNSGLFHAGRDVLSLALDSSGAPGIAYAMLSTDSARPNDSAYLFTRPTGSPVVVDTSDNVQNDAPQLALAFDGVKPRVAGHLAKATGPAHQWVWASADGATFSAAQVPEDAEDKGGAYLDLSYQAGKGVLAYDYSGSGAKGTCGGPKLARSADTTTWTICGADDLSHQFLGEYVTAELTSSGKLMAAFFTDADEASPSRFGKGLVLYREP